MAKIDEIIPKIYKTDKNSLEILDSFYEDQSYDPDLEKDYISWRGFILSQIGKRIEAMIEVDKLLELIDAPNLRLVNALNLKADLLIQDQKLEDAQGIIDEGLNLPVIKYSTKTSFLNLLVRLYQIKNRQIPEKYRETIKHLLQEIEMVFEFTNDLKEDLNTILKANNEASRRYGEMYLTLRSQNQKTQVATLENFIKKETIGKFKKMAQDILDNIAQTN